MTSSKKSSSRRPAPSSLEDSARAGSHGAPASDGAGDEILDSRDQAKQRALALLQQVLTPRTDIIAVPDIISVVKDALGGTFKMDGARARRTPGKVSRHDEFCNICELGGDLLCCDTCPKVFHLNCMVPKLAAVPRGTWSCPSCIIQNIARGDSSQALANLKKMQGNSKAAKSSSEQEFVVCFLDDGAILIQKAASRYVVRLTHKYRAREVGRFYTLHEALEQASALKRGVYGDLRAVASSTAEAPGGLRREAGGDDEDAEEALECIYCMDDPAVEICAFCGCVDCYGKTNTDNMLTCEECSVRRHVDCVARGSADGHGGGGRTAGAKQDSIAANSKKRRSALRNQHVPWHCDKCAKELSKSSNINPVLVPTVVSECPKSEAVAASPASASEAPKKKKKRVSGPSTPAEILALDQSSGAAGFSDGESISVTQKDDEAMEGASETVSCDETISKDVAEVEIPSIINKDSILGLLLPVCRSRALTEAEAEVAALFRRTAHMKDLEAVLGALKAEKAVLLNQ